MKEPKLFGRPTRACLTGRVTLEAVRVSRPSNRNGLPLRGVRLARGSQAVRRREKTHRRRHWLDFSHSGLPTHQREIKRSGGRAYAAESARSNGFLLSPHKRAIQRPSRSSRLIVPVNLWAKRPTHRLLCIQLPQLRRDGRPARKHSHAKETRRCQSSGSLVHSAPTRSVSAPVAQFSHPPRARHRSI